jgi:hypothetical protein
MKKKVLIVLAAIFIIIQFFRPDKNLSNDRTNDISKKYNIPPEVSTLLSRACYNCHSNLTKYPWYHNIQPIAWWMSKHVKKGKQRLNFSDFTSRKIAVQNRKFEGIIENVREKKMPIPSYTWFGLHPEARLTEPERDLIIDWATAQMDTLKAHYPADSLKLPKRLSSPSK